MDQIKGWYDILEDILQCPVCLDVTKTRLYQCSCGHHICHLCCSKLNVCPMCKHGFTQTRNLAMEDLISRLADIQVAIDDEHAAILAKNKIEQRSVSTETDFAVGEKVSTGTQTTTEQQIQENLARKDEVSFPCFVTSCQLSFPFLPLVHHLKQSHKNVFCEVRATGNVFSQRCIIDTSVVPMWHDFVVHWRNNGLFFFQVTLQNITNMAAKVIFVNSDVLPVRFLYELKLENKYVMQKLHKKVTLRHPNASHHKYIFYMKREDTRRLIDGDSFGCTLTITRQDSEV